MTFYSNKAYHNVYKKITQMPPPLLAQTAQNVYRFFMPERSTAQNTAVLLGIMQDGGLPHIGCRCPRCLAAFADPRRAEYAASLGIVSQQGTETAVFLIDATPDIGRQMHLLADHLRPHPDHPQKQRPPDAIFLTHAHMGHTTGLAQLGPEAMAVQNLPVYAAPGLLTLIEDNPLWQPLVANLDLRPLIPHKSISLAPNLTLTPMPVPHRDEWGTGTFAFRVQGLNLALLYLPDIDGWAQWPQAAETLSDVDVALVDATFFSPAELNGRSPVAHPLVLHTVNQFAALNTQLVLIHLNHTNPLLDPDSSERQTVHAAGVAIGQTGQQWLL